MAKTNDAVVEEEVSELYDKPQQSIDLLDNYVELLDPSDRPQSPDISPNLSAESDKPSKPTKSSTSLTKKRIIFIRHAQSTWNEVSESNPVGKVSALTKGLFESMSNKKNVKDGGKYIDAPLSSTGILQSTDLNRFLQLHFVHLSIKRTLKDASRRRTSRAAQAHSFDFSELDEHKSGATDEFTALSADSISSVGGKELRELRDMICIKSSKSLLNSFVFDTVDLDNDGTKINPKVQHRQRCKLIERDLRSLLGSNNSSCVVTSNLRRAIDTAIIGLSIRWQTFPLENLSLLSCLQEFGKGPDCYSKTAPQCVPEISQLTQTNPWLNLQSLKDFYRHRIDATMNGGSKKDENASRFDRMLEFCRYVFMRDEATVVVVGHSNWFQRFCRIFLLKNKEKQTAKNASGKERRKLLPNLQTKHHISIQSKLYNAGCVGFDLCRIVKKDTDYYGIDSRTMVVLYKGFLNMDKMTSKN